MTRGLLGVALAGAALTCAANTWAENLVPDPSFEAPTPAWFAEEGGPDYVAGKQKVTAATDGENVLVIQGWNKGGSLVPSGPVPLGAKKFSATMDVRTFGPSVGGTVELALFDVSKKNKLATFGSVPIDGAGKWATIRASGVALTGAATQGVLGITVGGPMRGSRVEVDRLGLFAGRALEPIVNTARFAWFEAETMLTNGKSWRPRDHFATWYREFPSGMKMISGSDGVADVDDLPATQTLPVTVAGAYTLWTRFLCTNAANKGSFEVSLKQDGRTIASRQIDDSDPQFNKNQAMEWVYTPLQATLRAGPVEVVLTRPAHEASGVARKVDLFALTNLATYQPKIQDFRPQGYVRFTNAGTTPFCLWQNVFRSQGPDFAAGRMFTAAGLWLGYSCPQDKQLLPGEPSPWVKISDYLRPDRNIVTFTATTKSHDGGYVSGEVKGAFEIALGSARQVIRTVSIDQQSPRTLLTLGNDLTAAAIRTPADYIAKEEAAVAVSPSWSRPRAKRLDLVVILDGVSPDLDPPDVFEKEIGLIERLGFNGTYTPITEPKDTRSFYAAHGLSHVGIWGAGPVYRSGDMNDPDLTKITAAWAQIGTKYGPILDKIERAKIFDEPTSMSYDAIASSAFSRTAFPTWLKGQGLSPSDVGVASWDQVVPVRPDRNKQEARLFYWTGMYRLNSLATAAKAVVEAKKKAGIPDNVRTYANYPTTWSNDSFTHLGADPFMMQRDGGLEMGWAEDWVGYGTSEEQVSDHVALLRAAGAPTHQQLGMYIVGADGPPALQRLRFYEALAAGVRHICSYNYGPYYNSIDSWGTRYEVYPFISDALHDFGAIDEALDGTTRRKSDVAILYNRAAAIWADDKTAVEQDGRYIFWALAHAGYQPEFIAEEDVERGGLAAFKVLYVLGVQMRRQTAAAIAGLVSKGGGVFATAGAGSRDEYDQPLDALDPVFGAHSAGFELFADPARPKYELHTLQPQGVLATVPGSGVPEVRFNRLCAKESLTPAGDAKIILKDESGSPAGVLHSYGKGSALRIAALPGITYLNDAVKDPAFDRESYHPTAYRPELRDFIAFAATLAHAERIETNAPIVEVVRYDAADRVVLIVVNHGAPVPGFEMEIADASVVSGYSATGTPVVVSALGGDAAKVAFHLEVADAVVLSRRPVFTPIVPPVAKASAVRCACRTGPAEGGRAEWLGGAAWVLAVLGRRLTKRLEER